MTTCTNHVFPRPATCLPVYASACPYVFSYKYNFMCLRSLLYVSGSYGDVKDHKFCSEHPSSARFNRCQGAYGDTTSHQEDAYCSIEDRWIGQKLESSWMARRDYF